MITLLFWFRRPCFFSTILVLSTCTITFVKAGMSHSFSQGCQDHLRLCRFFSANAFFNMTFLSTLSVSLFFFDILVLSLYTTTFVKAGMLISFRHCCDDHLRLCCFLSANAAFLGHFDANLTIFDGWPEISSKCCRQFSYFLASHFSRS